VRRAKRRRPGKRARGLRFQAEIKTPLAHRCAPC
jgi:hypothetical protein